MWPAVPRIKSRGMSRSFLVESLSIVTVPNRVPSDANSENDGVAKMLGTRLDSRSFLDRVAIELGRVDAAEVNNLADAIFRCYETGHFVFLCGNGGSGSNCSHFCEDLGKCTLRREDFDNDQKRRIRTLSLTDN